MNSFATAKLMNLKPHENNKDSTYILGQPGANLSDDVIDRLIKFEVRIYNLIRFVSLCWFIVGLVRNILELPTEFEEFLSIYTTQTSSEVLKKFTSMNSFATAKLMNLKTHEDHKGSSYILGQPRANLSDDVMDRVIKFEVRIYNPVRSFSLRWFIVGLV